MKYENGIYSDISNADYHASDGASKSDLFLLQRSAAHLWAERIDPNREPRTETPAMLTGTAVHYATLQPAEFEARYLCGPNNDARTKEWKAAAEQAEAEGKRILKPAEHEQIMAMATAYRSHPMVAELLAAGVAEQSIFWSLAHLPNAQFKTRPDWISYSDEILDLKTTDDARPEHWARHAVNLGYPMQAAMQIDGYQAQFGEPPARFLWAVCERAKPNGVVVYEPDPDMIEFGRKQWLDLAARYAQCVFANHWPGYSRGVEQLFLPTFAQREYDAMIGNL